MPITYAGIPFAPPVHARDAVWEYWGGQANRIFQADHPAFLMSGVDHLPIPYPSLREPPRIGVLYWPNGASRWATCHLLATGSQLAQLPTSGAAQSLVISDGTRSVTAPMYRLAARPVSQRGDGRELYLITLVDDRYYWYSAGNQAAPTSPSTWSGLLTSLFTSIGVTPSIDSISANYSTPQAARWNVGYKPIPLLIDAVCRTVGLRCIRSLAGSVSCVLYSTAAASDASQWTTYSAECLAGGRAANAESGRVVPASCGVVFLGTTNSVNTQTLSGLSLSQFTGVSGVSSKVGQVIADLPSSANSTVQGNYATQAATDFYLWQLSLTDATFRAIRNWTPTGLEDCVEWSHGREEIVTRVIRGKPFDPNTYGGGPSVSSVPDSGTGIAGSQNTVPIFITADIIGPSPYEIQVVNNSFNSTQINTTYVFLQFLGANTVSTPFAQLQVTSNSDNSNTARVQLVVNPSGSNTTTPYTITVTPQQTTYLFVPSPQSGNTQLQVTEVYSQPNANTFFTQLQVTQVVNSNTPFTYQLVTSGSNTSQGFNTQLQVTGPNTTAFSQLVTLAGTNTSSGVTYATSGTDTHAQPQGTWDFTGAANAIATTQAVNTNTTQVATCAFAVAQAAAGGSGRTEGTYTAAGTNISNATIITTDTALVTSVPVNNNGVIIGNTKNVSGAIIAVHNGDANNNLKVYPPSNSVAFGGNPPGTASVLAPSGYILLTRISSTQWN